MGGNHSDLATVGKTIFNCIISPVLEPLIGIFVKKPEDTNDTMRAIQANVEREEQERRLQESDQARAKERTREKQEWEAAAREHEEAALSAARLREEAALSDAKEFEAAADEARKQEAAAKSREEAALAEAKQANNALRQGIRPVVMPSKVQFEAAMERVEYYPEKLHFAFCGTSGGGKSSLINAFRGLGPRDGGAAAVGVTETTLEVTRYPDPRSEIPYSRFVWYDIPGAGTTAVSDWQYFNDQGLFVFDFIVMVYDVRFTKIDVGIVENCYRFNIPVFIVRSKADQHIENMIKYETDSKPGDDDYNHIYQEMTSKFVTSTKSDFDRHIDAMADGPEVDARDRLMLLNQRVYVVSSENVRGLLQSTEVKKGRAVDKSKIIDEVLLVEDMLRAAARRRYSKPEEKGLFRKGRVAISAGLSSLRLGSVPGVEASISSTTVDSGAEGYEFVVPTGH